MVTELNLGFAHAVDGKGFIKYPAVMNAADAVACTGYYCRGRISRSLEFMITNNLAKKMLKEVLTTFIDNFTASNYPNIRSLMHNLDFSAENILYY